MLTLDRKQQPPALVERSPFEPSFLAGLLFCGLFAVPLTSSAPLTGMRVLGLLILVTAAGGLMLRGLPRTRRRPLPSHATSGTSPAERCVRLELTGIPLPPTYRAVAVFADGRSTTLLERDEPGGVLTDATELAHELGVPLTPGWGLDDATLDELLDPSLRGTPRWSHDAPIKFDSPPLAGQRNAAWTTLWASAFVAVATVLMSDAARATVTPSSLSIVLPALSAVLVLIIALWLLGVRGELVLEPTGVVRRRFWFSFALGAPEVAELGVVAAAFAVPPGGVDGHLLLSSGASLHAFKVRGAGAQTTLLRGNLTRPAAHRAAE